MYRCQAIPSLPFCHQPHLPGWQPRPPWTGGQGSICRPPAAARRSPPTNPRVCSTRVHDIPPSSEGLGAALAHWRLPARRRPWGPQDRRTIQPVKVKAIATATPVRRVIGRLDTRCCFMLSGASFLGYSFRIGVSLVTDTLEHVVKGMNVDVSRASTGLGDFPCCLPTSRLTPIVTWYAERGANKLGLWLIWSY